MMQEQSNVCAVCNIVATLRCSGCQAVYYCSQNHQKSHWKTHSKICQPYKLVENSQLGRHMVATRNIKIGEIVVCDKVPLITLPGNRRVMKPRTSTFSSFDSMETDKAEDGHCRLKIFAQPVCLSCYIELKVDDAKPCVKCGWPLCRNCTKHGTECEFTMKHRTSRVNIQNVSVTQYGQYHAAYAIIGVIRALALRENDPEAYRKLMNLKDRAAKANEIMINLEESVDKAARYAKTFLNIEDIEFAEICKIIRITLFNAFQLDLETQACSAVYARASYIEHNCRANCSFSFTAEKGILFWAAEPIFKGEHISIAYAYPFWGTEKRREYLMLTRFIDCRCERCTDPTEFGTMFNAIKCTKDNCNGYALPFTFLAANRNYGNFVCRKCEKTVPRQLSDIMQESIGMSREALGRNISQCEKFIETSREHLHENNAYIFDVEIQLCATILDQFDLIWKQPLEYWRKVLVLCTKLTELLQILGPAQNVPRAAILYLKFRATALLNGDKSITVDEKIESVKMCQKDLRQVEELLRREPACLPFEQSLLKSARKDLKKLKDIENNFAQNSKNILSVHFHKF